MAIVTLVKRGVGTVTMIQQTSGGLVDVQLCNDIGFYTDKDGANELYLQYIRAGYTVKPTKETKVAAPKEPKPKKTREQSLTEKYGDIESRRAYIAAKKAFHRYFMNELKGRNVSNQTYLKAVDLLTKKTLANWEAAGRPSYNC